MARVAALLDRPRPATPLRLAAALLPLLLVDAGLVPRADAQPTPLEIDTVADLDDDDLNGLPDGSEASLAPGARVDVVPLDASLTGSTLVAESGGDHARILVAGHPLAWGERVPAGAGVQGLSPGVVAVHAIGGGATRPLSVVVSSLGFRDGQGRVVDPARRCRRHRRR